MEEIEKQNLVESISKISEAQKNNQNNYTTMTKIIDAIKVVADDNPDKIIHLCDSCKNQTLSNADDKLKGLGIEIEQLKEYKH